ncbi:hypothetical protein [Roseibium sp. RKSG952]|uniref:hypothetical protein n=1 Tax=Roseibium sp. RKSG952 TaxID=2529384 RepID=UPI0012BC6F2C|nr:hypothetical protein [Roseibium sp. RKSG952]MTH96980.1 hypothetical protein [Roseibium sp. RKSG952]
MNVMKDEKIMEILERADRLNRTARELQLNIQIARYDAGDEFEHALHSHLGVKRLRDVPDDVFDQAMVIGWTFIYDIRDALSGMKH